MDQDYYAALGVTRQATLGEIQRAYRKLAKLYHPDTGLPTADSEHMKKINEAYAVLSDATQRKQYDIDNPLTDPDPSSSNGRRASSAQQPSSTYRPAPASTPPPWGAQASSPPPPPRAGSSTFRPQENRGRLRVDGLDDDLFSPHESALEDNNNLLSIGLVPLWLILGVVCVVAPPRISSLSFIQHPNSLLADLAAMTVPLTCIAVFWVAGIPFCLYKVVTAFSERKAH